MKGQVDENAVTGGVDDPKFSDVEVSNSIEKATTNKVNRGHTNPPHPHTSDLINSNDLNCSEESSVLRAFSELLHLINSNLNLLNGWLWGWGGFVWSQ